MIHKQTFKLQRKLMQQAKWKVVV